MKRKADCNAKNALIIANLNKEMSKNVSCSKF